MGRVIVNIIVVLGFCTVAFAGYYFYSQTEGMALNAGEAEQITQKMLADTRVFMERRKQLEAIKLDFSILEDKRFTALQSYRTEIPEEPIGKSNPFEIGDDTD